MILNEYIEERPDQKGKKHKSQRYHTDKKVGLPFFHSIGLFETKQP